MNTTVKQPLSAFTILRLVVAIGLLAFLGWFILNHWHELSISIGALRNGRWPWLSGVLLAVMLYFVIVASYYNAALSAFGVHMPPGSLIFMLFGAQSVSIVTPSEFIATHAILILGAQRNKQSVPKTILAALLVQLLELFAFLSIVIVGLILLMRFHKLDSYQITASYILLLLSSLLTGVLVAIAYQPTLPGQAFRFMRNTLKIPIPQASIKSFDKQLIEVVNTTRHNVGLLVRIFTLGIVAHSLRILCLVFLFKAFAIVAALAEAIPAYCIGTLTLFFSPIPQGIGIVEGSYSLALSSLGVPSEAATTVALAFRMFVFWVPFTVGLFALWRLNYFDKKKT